MKLISWNVQWCRGMDGCVDPARILRCARALADFDVLCLQEVARNWPGLPGSRGEDQFQLLCEGLPGYRGYYVAATDVDDGRGGRSRFGNALFTRLPVAQACRRLLPWPADPGVPSMQRGVVEVVVRAGAQWLRIATTHLEYYSTAQRIAQVHALRTLHLEASAHAAAPRRDAGEAGTPFAPTPRPASALLCGDFNFRPDSIEHALLTAPMDAGAPPLVDAWRTRHPGVPHPATFCVHDAGCTAYCCDFVFASVDLAQRVTAVTVDGDCRASDHQPVLLELEA